MPWSVGGVQCWGYNDSKSGCGQDNICLEVHDNYSLVNLHACSK